jgi:hypothetical protein
MKIIQKGKIMKFGKIMKIMNFEENYGKYEIMKL